MDEALATGKRVQVSGKAVHRVDPCGVTEQYKDKTWVGVLREQTAREQGTQRRWLVEFTAFTDGEELPESITKTLHGKTLKGRKTLKKKRGGDGDGADGSQSTSTVKCTLAKIGVPRAVRQAIDDQVRALQQNAVEGTLLYQAFILHLLETGQALPEQNGHGLIVKCLYRSRGVDRAQVPRKSNNDALEAFMVEHYEPLRTPDLPYATSDNLGSAVMGEHAKQYWTMCKNHVLTNFRQRIEAWGRRSLHGLQLTKQNQWKAVNAVKQYLLFSETGSVEEAEALQVLEELLTEETVTTLREQFAVWKGDKYADLYPIYDWRLERSWYKFLPWLYELQQHAEDFVQGFHGREEQLPKGISRTFSLLPVLDLTSAKHISITTSSLTEPNGIVHHAVKKYGMLPVDDDEDVWESCFPRLPKHSKHEFARHIKTDGVAVSIVFDREQPQGQEPAQKRQRNADEPYADATRIVGIDPGRRDLFTGVIRTDNTASGKVDPKEDVIQCSNKRYQGLRGTTRQKKKTERRLQNIAVQVDDRETTLFDALKDLPSAKTSTTAGFLRRVAAVYALFPQLLEVACRYTSRSDRFESYRRKYQALDVLCKEITASDKNCVVAMGDFSGTTGWGHAPAPNAGLIKRLKRHAHMVMIDEYNTSKVCSHCLLTHGHECTVRPAKRQDGSEIWGVRICPRLCTAQVSGESSCRPHLHRDVNAALNILHIFDVTVLQKQDRPACFARPA